MNRPRIYPRSAKIDWLSFTMKVGMSNYLSSSYLNALLDMIGMNSNDLWTHIWNNANWTHGGGQWPYAQSLRSDTGVILYYDHRQDYVLIQFTGVGCKWLYSENVMDDVLVTFADRITRLDIAVDILCDVTPTEFVDAGVSARFRSRGYVTSEQGDTCYIGSRKSTLFTRIYRYKDPHPRADRLRIEFECKAERAKTISAAIRDNGLAPVAATLGRILGFVHPAWEETALVAEIEPMAGNRSDNATLIWMYKQVVPAFKRLVENGVIEHPVKWLQEVFLDESS